MHAHIFVVICVEGGARQLKVGTLSLLLHCKIIIFGSAIGLCKLPMAADSQHMLCLLFSL
jgi:hypothetical protein